MKTFPDSAQRLFTNAITNHTVSIADRYDLMSALLDRDLEAAEFAAVDQIVHSLQAANRPQSAIVPKTAPILEFQPRQLRLIAQEYCKKINIPKNFALMAGKMQISLRLRQRLRSLTTCTTDIF